MVAVIGSGISIRKSFLYNENKMERGIAACLMAANYPLDLDQMDQSQRLSMLVKTSQMNSTVQRPSIHISLNFAPEEQLSDLQLRNIASDYMQEIGFGQQPFLVYRHDDAAHPHIHIVSTNITPEGKRIDTFNIGKLRSEPARKHIENKYGLVRAEQQKDQVFMLKAVDPSKAIYGKQTTKEAISGVLQNVLQNYRYTSLSELNAVLNLYNIHADQGTENSSHYKHRGLVYHLLDGDGKAVGVPLKASVLYNNPGLDFLEKKYLANDVARSKFRQQLRSTIDLLTLRNPNIDLQQFIQKMKASAVQVIPRMNGQGRLYGITYVDHRSKCVFNASALGKKYSAAGLFSNGNLAADKTIPGPPHKEIVPPKDHDLTYRQQELTEQDHDRSPSGKGLLEELMDYQYSEQNVPYQWKKKKKKKKKR